MDNDDTMGEIDKQANKLQCLELAVKITNPVDYADANGILKTAKLFYSFVTGDENNEPK